MCLHRCVGLLLLAGLGLSYHFCILSSTTSLNNNASLLCCKWARLICTYVYMISLRFSVYTMPSGAFSRDYITTRFLITLSSKVLCKENIEAVQWSRGLESSLKVTGRVVAVWRQYHRVTSGTTAGHWIIIHKSVSFKCWDDYIKEKYNDRITSSPGLDAS